MTDIAVTPSEKKKFIEVKSFTCYGTDHISTLTINLHDIISLREDRPRKNGTTKILRTVETLFDCIFVDEKEFNRIKNLLKEFGGEPDADSKSGQVGFK